MRRNGVILLRSKQPTARRGAIMRLQSTLGVRAEALHHRQGLPAGEKGAWSLLEGMAHLTNFSR